MNTVSISPKFQIVIPQQVREALGLRVGEKAHVISYRNRIEIIPVRDDRKLRSYLKGIDTSFPRETDRRGTGSTFGREKVQFRAGSKKR